MSAGQQPAAGWQQQDEEVRARERLQQLKDEQAVLQCRIRAEEERLRAARGAAAGGDGPPRYSPRRAGASPFAAPHTDPPPEPFATSPPRGASPRSRREFTGRVLATADGAPDCPHRHGDSLASPSPARGGARAGDASPGFASVPGKVDEPSPQEALAQREREARRSRAGLWSTECSPQRAACRVPVPHRRSYRSYGDTERQLPPAAPPVLGTAGAPPNPGMPT